MINDQQPRIYMQRALDLARQAEGRTAPNPPVGAVIVKAFIPGQELLTPKFLRYGKLPNRLLVQRSMSLLSPVRISAKHRPVPMLSSRLELIRFLLA